MGKYPAVFGCIDLIRGRIGEMNKKNLIIIIAACVVCLGAGVLIGSGLNQKNLSATSADQSLVIDSALKDEDVAEITAMQAALTGMENTLQEYAQRLQVINEKRKQARTTLAEIRDMIEEEAFVMTDEMYNDLRDMIETGDDEVFEALIKDLRDLDMMLTCKPGDTLSIAEWKAIEAEVETIMNGLGEVSDLAQYDLQNVQQDYSQAVNTIAAIMKQAYDDSMKIISNLRG